MRRTSNGSTCVGNPGWFPRMSTFKIKYECNL